MKILKTLLVLLFISTFALVQNSYGQDIRQGTKTIVDDINSKKVGQGDVKVMQDETIDIRLAKYNTNADSLGVIRLSDEKANGYKVQVFSGNNQNKSRQEAEYKRGLIKDKFSEHQALVTYDTPNWRLRVGNFLTRSEAEGLLTELKEAFPSFGREMYVVSDVVRKPLKNNY